MNIRVEAFLDEYPFLRHWIDFLYSRTEKGVVQRLDDNILETRIRPNSSHEFFFFDKGGKLVGRVGCRSELRRHWIFWKKSKGVFFEESLYECLLRHKDKLDQVFYGVYFGIYSWDGLVLYKLPVGQTDFSEWVQRHEARIRASVKEEAR